MDTISIDGNCRHVFTRGEKKGETCTTKLRCEKSRLAQRCAVHHPNQLQRINDTNRERSRQNSVNLYRVTANNTEGVFYKKLPKTTIVKVMKESRARALEKKGAKLELLCSDDQGARDLAQVYAGLLVSHGIPLTAVS